MLINAGLSKLTPQDGGGMAYWWHHSSILVRIISDTDYPAFLSSVHPDKLWTH